MAFAQGEFAYVQGSFGGFLICVGLFLSRLCRAVALVSGDRDIFIRVISFSPLVRLLIT